MHNVMMNNRQFRALGLGPIHIDTPVNGGRTKTKEAKQEKSSSLYQPGDEEDVEQGVDDQVYAMLHDDYSFVLIMQDYLLGSNLLYYVGCNAGFGGEHHRSYRRI